MKYAMAALLIAVLISACDRCGPCKEVEPADDDFCQGGLVFSGFQDECGCVLAPQCMKPECGDCPLLMPPGPDFCPDGTIVDGGKDICGCQMPPRCVNCGDCPMLAPPSPDFCRDGKIVYSGEDPCGCQLPPRCIDENSCLTDDDCACGRHIRTGECFAGNKEFVHADEQCPDFCSGIDGRMATKCVLDECQQVREP